MGVSIWEGNKAQELIDAVSGGMEKVNLQQGAGNAGKALIVGSDGIVTTGYTTLSNIAIQALLNCFAHVTWIDDQGNNYYDILEAALYEGKDTPDTGKIKVYKKSDFSIISAKYDTSATIGAYIITPSTEAVSAFFSSGSHQLLDVNGTQTGYYPIEIPQWAKSVVIFIHDPTVLLDTSSRKFDAQLNNYGPHLNGNNRLSDVCSSLNFYYDEDVLALSFRKFRDGASSTISVNDINEFEVVFLPMYVHSITDWYGCIKDPYGVNPSNNLGDRYFTKYKLSDIDGALYAVSDNNSIILANKNTPYKYPIYGTENVLGGYSAFRRPEGSTKITVNITPTTLNLNLQTRSLDKTTGKFSSPIQSMNNISGGTAILTFNSDSEEYVTIWASGGTTCENFIHMFN